MTKIKIRIESPVDEAPSTDQVTEALQSAAVKIADEPGTPLNYIGQGGRPVMTVRYCRRKPAT